jgi:hypothetical protein
MKLVFNPTGTHVKQNIKTGDKFLKVRLDFYPEETEKTYQQHYVYVPVFPETGYPGKVDEFGNPTNQVQYDKWVEGLPHIWQLNPAICCFFTVPENIQVADFLLELANRFKPDDIATLDNYLILPDSAHYISPFTRNRLKLTTQKVLTSDIEDLKATINERFASIQELNPSGGSPLNIQPQSITIGQTITKSSFQDVDNYSRLCSDNAANADGSLDTVEVYTQGNCNALKAGTFFLVSGTTYECRDVETIANVTGGSPQQLAGLDITVVTGDLIGVKADDNIAIETAGSLHHRYTGYGVDALVASQQTSFGGSLARGLYLYGTGTESGGGWAGEFCGVAVEEFDGVIPEEIDGV